MVNYIMASVLCAVDWMVGEPVKRSLVPRPHPRGEGLVTSS